MNATRFLRLPVPYLSYCVLSTVVVMSSSLISSVQAQRQAGNMSFTQTCFTDINNPNSQSIAVDERDRIHISRLNPENRQLIYTQVNGSDMPFHEIVADPIDLEINPVNDSAILARHDQVYICAYRSTAMSRELVLFVRNQEGTWWEEIIEDNGSGGQSCEITWLDNTLHIATQVNGAVHWYSRGEQAWSNQVLTDTNGSQGFDLKLHKNNDGSVMLTHRSSNYMHLYLTWLEDGQWQSHDVVYSEPYNYSQGAGVRPQALKWPDGTVWIFHGSRNGNSMLDWDEDGYSLVTESPTTENNFTFRFLTNDSRSGGINAARMLTGPDGREECYFLTRELNRSALANDAFGLLLNRFTYDFSFEEFYQLQQSIPGVPNIHLEPEIHSDSAGLPIVSHIDRGVTETKSCFWRLIDSDGDGLADEGETRLGTDPMLPDSDGDGRFDGLEVQEGTDPLLSDEAQPLSWPPEILPFGEEMTGGSDMAGTEMAGETAGMEVMAGETAGMEVMAGETAGMEVMAGETAGMEVMAGEAAGMEVMAGEAAGMEVVAGEAAGMEVMAGETAGMEVMAGEVAGMEVMAGEVTAGETTDMEVNAGEVTGGELTTGESAGTEGMAGEMSAGILVDDQEEAEENDSGDSQNSSKGGCDQQSAQGTFWYLLIIVAYVFRSKSRHAGCK